MSLKITLASAYCGVIVSQWLVIHMFMNETKRNEMNGNDIETCLVIGEKHLISYRLDKCYAVNGSNAMSEGFHVLWYGATFV